MTPLLVPRHLIKNDFLKQPSLKGDPYKEAVIAQAVSTARDGFPSLPLAPNDLAGRRIYQIDDLASDLVLRKAAQNVRRITGSKQSSRMEIVRRLKPFYEEGMPFTIAKMDIKNFVRLSIKMFFHVNLKEDWSYNLTCPAKRGKSSPDRGHFG